MPTIPSIPQPIKRRTRGYFSPQDGLATIRDSIVTILVTRIGERVHLPEFGSRLHELVFEQQDEAFQVLAQEYVFEALRTWEPRIDLISAVVSFSKHREHTAELAIQFRVRQPIPAESSLTLAINRDTGFIELGR